MFTPQQYRAKAAEYAALVKTASNTDEAREFRKLEISFAALAANSQWMADNQNKTVHPPVMTQEKDDKDIPGAVNQTEKTQTNAIHDAVAIANWNDEGGAPPAPAQRQVLQQQQRPWQAADHEQADR